MKEFEIALEIALRAHAGQKDKQGVDYIEHPKKVSGYCRSERAGIAAILHDVVEDSAITLDDIRKAGISEDIVSAVACLTKHKRERLDDYFNRVASNDMAIEVKFADMRHNSDGTRWPKEMKDKATAIGMMYGDRIRHLYRLVGGNRARGLMTEETYDYLFPFLIEIL